MQKFRYSDLLACLDDPEKGFDKWLGRLGVPVRRDDRIHRAFHVLRSAETASRIGRETEHYTNIEPQHLFPLIEALEAYEIYCAFGQESSKELAGALARALSGPSLPIDERNESSRDGRNIWFELALAAEWKLRGATVRLCEPDLRLFRGDTEFLVACKRPASENSIRSNIRAAISQLNEALRPTSESVFGVVAVSVSRVLNAGDKYWSGGIEQLGDLLSNLMDEYSRHWRSADAHPKICTILLHAATPSDVGGEVDVSRATYTVATPLKLESAGATIFKEHALAMKTHC